MFNVQSPRTDDGAIEAEIIAKGLTAPRITATDIEANIACEYTFTAAQAVAGGPVHESLGLLTFCVLVLNNGFTVTGESACASPENFDADVGRKIARANAVNKVWPLMGYELRSKLAFGPERAARAAHEVNRAYCQALGDNSQPAWEDAPQWQRDSAMLGVKLHTEQPEAGPQASHESWMAQKVADGWVYGPEKNPDLKQHHCIVPFADLPVEQQAKDFIFRAVVHSLA